MDREAHFSSGRITTAQSHNIRAGTHHFLFLKHASPAVKSKEEKGSLSPGKKDEGSEAVLLITDTHMLLTAHRTTATNSSICHCHFPSAWHCSGNCMCKAELPASNFDKGTAVQGCLKLKQAYVSYYVPQPES